MAREELQIWWAGESDNIFVYYLTGALTLSFLITIWITRSLRRKEPKVIELLHEENLKEMLVTYLLSITTSITKGSSCPEGTKVFMQLYGTEYRRSQFFQLNTQRGGRPMFQRGNTDIFMFKVPVSLGKVEGVKLVLAGATKSLSWKVTSIQLYDPDLKEHCDLQAEVLVTETIGYGDATQKVITKTRPCVQWFLDVCIYHQWVAGFVNTVRFGSFTEVVHIMFLFSTIFGLLTLTLVSYIMLQASSLEDDTFDLNYVSLLTGSFISTAACTLVCFVFELIIRHVQSGEKKPGNAYSTAAKENKYARETAVPQIRDEVAHEVTLKVAHDVAHEMHVRSGETKHRDAYSTAAKENEYAKEIAVPQMRDEVAHEVAHERHVRSGETKHWDVYGTAAKENKYAKETVVPQKGDEDAHEVAQVVSHEVAHERHVRSGEKKPRNAYITAAKESKYAKETAVPQMRDEFANEFAHEVAHERHVRSGEIKPGNAYSTVAKESKYARETAVPQMRDEVAHDIAHEVAHEKHVRSGEIKPGKAYSTAAKENKYAKETSVPQMRDEVTHDIAHEVAHEKHVRSGEIKPGKAYSTAAKENKYVKETSVPQMRDEVTHDIAHEVTHERHVRSGEIKPGKAYSTAAKESKYAKETAVPQMRDEVAHDIAHEVAHERHVRSGEIKPGKAYSTAAKESKYAKETAVPQMRDEFAHEFAHEVAHERHVRSGEIKPGNAYSTAAKESKYARETAVPQMRDEVAHDIAHEVAHEKHVRSGEIKPGKAYSTVAKENKYAKETSVPQMKDEVTHDIAHEVAHERHVRSGEIKPGKAYSTSAKDNKYAKETAFPQMRDEVAHDIAHEVAHERHVRSGEIKPGKAYSTAGKEIKYVKETEFPQMRDEVAYEVAHERHVRSGEIKSGNAYSIAAKENKYAKETSVPQMRDEVAHEVAHGVTHEVTHEVTHKRHVRSGEIKPGNAYSTAAKENKYAKETAFPQMRDEVAHEVTHEVAHGVTHEVAHGVTREVAHEMHVRSGDKKPGKAYSIEAKENKYAKETAVPQMRDEVAHEVTHEVAHGVTHEVAHGVTREVAHEMHVRSGEIKPGKAYSTAAKENKYAKETAVPQMRDEVAHEFAHDVAHERHVRSDEIKPWNAYSTSAKDKKYAKETAVPQMRDEVAHDIAHEVAHERHVRSGEIKPGKAYSTAAKENKYAKETAVPQMRDEVAHEFAHDVAHERHVRSGEIKPWNAYSTSAKDNKYAKETAVPQKRDEVAHDIAHEVAHERHVRSGEIKPWNAYSTSTKDNKYAKETAVPQMRDEVAHDIAHEVAHERHVKSGEIKPGKAYSTTAKENKYAKETAFPQMRDEVAHEFAHEVAHERHVRSGEIKPGKAYSIAAKENKYAKETAVPQMRDEVTHDIAHEVAHERHVRSGEIKPGKAYSTAAKENKYAKETAVPQMRDEVAHEFAHEVAHERHVRSGEIKPWNAYSTSAKDNKYAKETAVPQMRDEVAHDIAHEVANERHVRSGEIKPGKAYSTAAKENKYAKETAFPQMRDEVAHDIAHEVAHERHVRSGEIKPWNAYSTSTKDNKYAKETAVPQMRDEVAHDIAHEVAHERHVKSGEIKPGKAYSTTAKENKYVKETAFPQMRDEVAHEFAHEVAHERHVRSGEIKPWNAYSTAAKENKYAKETSVPQMKDEVAHEVAYQRHVRSGEKKPGNAYSAAARENKYEKEIEAPQMRDEVAHEVAQESGNIFTSFVMRPKDFENDSPSALFQKSSISLAVAGEERIVPVYLEKLLSHIEIEKPKLVELQEKRSDMYEQGQSLISLKKSALHQAQVSMATCVEYISKCEIQLPSFSEVCLNRMLFDKISLSFKSNVNVDLPTQYQRKSYFDLLVQKVDKKPDEGEEEEDEMIIDFTGSELGHYIKNFDETTVEDSHREPDSTVVNVQDEIEHVIDIEDIELYLHGDRSRSSKEGDGAKSSEAGNRAKSSEAIDRARSVEAGKEVKIDIPEPSGSPSLRRRHLQPSSRSLLLEKRITSQVAPENVHLQDKNQSSADLPKAWKSVTGLPKVITPLVWHEWQKAQKSWCRKLIQAVHESFKACRVDFINGTLVVSDLDIVLLEWTHEVVKRINAACSLRRVNVEEDILDSNHLVSLLSHLSCEIVNMATKDVYRCLRSSEFVSLADLILQSHHVMLALEHAADCIAYLINQDYKDMERPIMYLDMAQDLADIRDSFIEMGFELTVSYTDITWAYFLALLKDKERTKDILPSSLDRLIEHVESQLSHENEEDVVLKKLCHSAEQEAKIEVWKEYQSQEYMFSCILIKQQILKMLARLMSAGTREKRKFDAKYYLIPIEPKSRLERLAEKRKDVASKAMMIEKKREEEINRYTEEERKAQKAESEQMGKYIETLSYVKDKMKKKWKREGVTLSVPGGRFLAQALLHPDINTEENSGLYSFKNFLHLRKTESFLQFNLESLAYDMVELLLTYKVEEYRLRSADLTDKEKDFIVYEFLAEVDMAIILLLQESHNFAAQVIEAEQSASGVDVSMARDQSSLLMSRLIVGNMDMDTNYSAKPPYLKMKTAASNATNQTDESSTKKAVGGDKNANSKDPGPRDSTRKHDDETGEEYKSDSTHTKTSTNTDETEAESYATPDWTRDSSSGKEGLGLDEWLNDEHTATEDDIVVPAEIVEKQKDVTYSDLVNDLIGELRPLKNYLEFMQKSEKIRHETTQKSYLERYREKREYHLSVCINNIIDSYYLLTEGDDSHTFTLAGLYQLEHDFVGESSRLLPRWMKTVLVGLLFLMILFSMVYVTLTAGQFSTTEIQEWVCFYLLSLGLFGFVFEPIRVVILGRIMQSECH